MQALTVHDISFRYDAGPPVLRRVSLEVARGEFLTLVGPNGSGKSTLLRLLDRILLPQEGAIHLLGRALGGIPRAELARRIAFVPQDAGMLFPFTVQEVVLMGRSPHSRGRLFESPEDRRIAEDVMLRMDIAHLAGHAVTALSGGERQRTFIARALAQQPDILLLDEPSAHLDIAHQMEVFGVLRGLRRDTGLTVVSVSHDLNLAAAYSDRVAMLLCGAITAAGTPAEVLTEERIREVFRTAVLVDRHPVDGTTRVSLITAPAVTPEPPHGHL